MAVIERSRSRDRRGPAWALLACILCISMSACTWSAAIPWPFATREDSPAERQEDSASLTVVAIATVTNLDPMYADAAAVQTILMHLFSGLAKWENEGGKLSIVPDAAEALPEPKESDDGSLVYRYTIRDDATWSDGRPVTARDFEYSWKRAAGLGGFSGPGPYRSMFSGLRGYSDDPAATDIAVRATDDRHLEVTLESSVPYWNQLLASPALFPVRQDIVESTPRWATSSTTFVSNGAYGMREWKTATIEDSLAYIDLSRREDHYAREKVQIPGIKFITQASAAEIWQHYASKEWPVLLTCPERPNGPDGKPIIEKEDVNFVMSPQIGTRFMSWNLDAQLLPDTRRMSPGEREIAQSDIRRALSLLIDRGGFLDAASGETAGHSAAASLVAPGIQETGGLDFAAGAGHGNGFTGYYDTSPEAYDRNKKEAMATLSEYYKVDDQGKLVDFPTVTLATTEEDALTRSVTRYFEECGIPVSVRKIADFESLRQDTETPWTFVNINWVADYADPMAFLSLWASNSANNYCGLGSGTHADVRAYSIDLTDLGYDVKVERGTWAETYDKLLDMANSERDAAKRFQILHRAEDLLMETGAICPLLHGADFYAVDKSVSDLLVTPLGYKVFSYAQVAKPSTGDGGGS